jgi:hypothetical protein
MIFSGGSIHLSEHGSCFGCSLNLLGHAFYIDFQEIRHSFVKRPFNFQLQRGPLRGLSGIDIDIS